MAAKLMQYPLSSLTLTPFMESLMTPDTTIMPKPGDTVWYFDSAAHFDEYQRGNPEIKPFEAKVDSVVGANCVNLEVRTPEGQSVSRSGVTLWQPAEEGRGFPNGPHARWPDERVGELRAKMQGSGHLGTDPLANKLETYQEAHVTDTNRTVPALKPEASELANGDRPLVGDVPATGNQNIPGAGSVGHPEHGHPQAAPTDADKAASATTATDAKVDKGPAADAAHKEVNQAAKKEAEAVAKDEADKAKTDASQGNSNRNNPGRPA